MPATPAILLVDDNVAALKATARILEKAGYEVTQAADGASALREVRARQPSLVLLDVVLPDLSGPEVLRQIREDPALARVPVVLLSSLQTNPEQQAAGLDAGADGYIARPIASAELLARVRLQLRQRELTEQLRASEQQFSSAFESAAIGMALIAPDGRFLKVNRALCQMLGYAEAELQALTFQELTFAADLDDQGQVASLLAGEIESFQMEKRYRHRQGHLVTGLLSMSLARDATGQPVHQIAQIQDITERVQGESRLRRSETNLAASQRMAHLGSWEMDLVNVNDLTQGVLRWSDEVFRIWGHEPRSIEVTYDNFLAAVHPHDRALIGEAVSAALRDSRSYDLTHRILRPDGTERIVRELAEFQLEEGTGRPLRMIGTVMDITEQRRAEEAVRRLAAIVESSDDAIVGKDLQGIVTSWNAGAERLFGFAAAEMIGQSIRRIIPPERQDEEAIILAQIVQGKTIRNFETVRVRQGGSFIDVAVTISAIRDVAGKIVGGSKVARDISAQKRAADQLKRSEASLANAQHIARIGNWDLDIATQSLSWSAEIYEIFGLSRAEFGASYEAFMATVHPEDRARVDAAQRAAVAGETRLDLDHRIVRPDGTERFVHEFADLTRDAAGRPAHLAGTMQDITERMQAEAKLRESEAQFRTMLDAMSQLAWMAEADGSIYWYNQQWYDYTGTTPEQMKGWGWQRVHDPEFLPGVVERWRAAIDGGQLFEMDFPLRAADGSYRWFLTRGVPLKDLRGRVARWLGTNTDITEKREAAQEITRLNATLEQRVVERTEALRESEQRLAVAVQAAHAGVWAWDVHSGRLTWSPEASQIFGLDPARAEVSVEEWRGLVHPDDRAGAEQRMADAIQKRTRMENEYRVISPSGELRWISVLGDTSYAEDGEPRRMAGVCLDITERKRTELELQKMASDLQAANQALEAFSLAVTHDLRVAEAADRIKSAFLATMSHELRTPLNSIIGFTGIVLMGKAGPLNAEQKTQLGMVQESAWHLLALINDVLDLSKIEAGQIEVRVAPFHLPASIDRVLAMVGPLAEKKGLVLAAEVAPELGEMVGDQRRVEQILLNLLSNAVKFTDQGRVTLTAGVLADFRSSPKMPPRPAVRLRVADTGIGIRPEDLLLLFQPFRQIDSGLARQAEGTGLGLAISRRLATMLGGEISAASTWSQGSEFTVILPLQKPSTP